MMKKDIGSFKITADHMVKNEGNHNIKEQSQHWLRKHAIPRTKPYQTQKYITDRTKTNAKKHMNTRKNRTFNQGTCEHQLLTRRCRWEQSRWGNEPVWTLHWYESYWTRRIGYDPVSESVALELTVWTTWLPQTQVPNPTSSSFFLWMTRN